MLKYPCGPKHFRFSYLQILGQKYALSSILPKQNTSLNGWCFVFCGGGEIRTHLNATVRRTVAATSSKTGGYKYLSFPLRE